MSDTLINPTEWTTAGEAARLLGVSHQRVVMLGDEGTIEMLRPWPRVALVSMASIEARLAGERAQRIMTTDARRAVLARRQVRSIHQLTGPVIADTLVAFITEARPLWSAERCVDWANDMAARLIDTREHTAEPGPGGQTLPRVDCPRCGRSVPARAGTPRSHRDGDGIICE